MTGPFRLPAFAILGLAAAACTRAVQVAPVTVNEALPAVACGEVAVDTAGWIDTYVADLGITFQRPAGFHPEAPGARQRPGWGAYRWRLNGGRSEAISAQVLNDGARQDRETRRARLASVPGARTCTVANEEQAAYVVVLDERALPRRATDDEFPPNTVIAEWTFTEDRVVRLTGNAKDPAELEKFLAVVQSARFTDTPVPPVQCSAPFDCGQISRPR